MIKEIYSTFHQSRSEEIFEREFLIFTNFSDTSIQSGLFLKSYILKRLSITNEKIKVDFLLAEYELSEKCTQYVRVRVCSLSGTGKV